MTSEQYLAYVVLRKAGKLGRVWTADGGYLLAPVSIDGYPVVPGMDYAHAEFITERAFLALIDTLSGVSVERKPVASEAGRDFGSVLWERGRKRG